MSYNESKSENKIEIPINYEQIKSKDRVNNHGEVLTPDWLVKDMLDILPKSVSTISSRYLETSAGEGAFLVEILRRKLNIIFKMYNNLSDIEFYTIVAICNIYGFELLKDNVEIARMRLEMVIRDFFMNEKNITVNDIFFDIVKMILEINIINMDSIKFREPIFDDNNQILTDSKGKVIYKDELACISEWEFDTDKKEVKRIEYYYQDVVNKQKEEYLLQIKQKQVINVNDDISACKDSFQKEKQENKTLYNQISFFEYAVTETDTKIIEKDNIKKITLKPVRVSESVNYLKLLDLK